ncbi:MAG TPA: crossover junction endodeoxyribonuclease RuvC [Chloroflexota bacterium]|nr:crossover junction endodeoxyribonuclease RuvC [Chloroflexota bacterium]
MPGVPVRPRGRDDGAAPIVLGIDPGIGTTGYAVVRGLSGIGGEGGLDIYRALDYGVVTTTVGAPLERRLLELHERLRTLIREHRPNQVAIEQLFFGRNVTTAVTVGQARGVALLAFAEAGLPIAEYKPAEIKHTVAGFGRADKVQMQRMVQRLLDLEEVPRPDDAADALAIAICHLRYAAARAAGLR